MGLDPFISRKTLQHLEPLKANPEENLQGGSVNKPSAALRQIKVRMGACRWKSLQHWCLGRTFLYINKSTS